MVTRFWPRGRICANFLHVNTDNKGKAFVIIGPSGSGKSTLVQKIKENIDSLQWSVSYTTREKRAGEIDGKDYFFVTEKEFLQKRAQGEFLEWAEVHGNLYGTSRDFIKTQINTGNFILLDIDIQGADCLIKLLPKQTITIFIAPPTLQELEKRLRKRKTDDEQTIQTRLNNARIEMTKKNDYNHIVINDNPEQSHRKLYNIIAGYLQK